MSEIQDLARCERANAILKALGDEQSREGFLLEYELGNIFSGLEDPEVIREDLRQNQIFTTE